MNPAPQTADASPVPPEPGALAFYERRYLAPLLAFLVHFKALFLLVYLGLVIPIRFDITFPEGAIAARAACVARGETAYADWREWPHQFAPYGPLTYYPAGWAARALGLGAQPMDLYAIGRTQSFLAILGLCAVLAWIGRIAAGGWIWGTLAASAFLAWRLQMEFAISFRPDAPAALFSLLALAISLHGPATALRIASAFAAVWVSFWFKPSAFGMVLALLLWVARERGWLRALAAYALFAFSGILPALLLNRLMDGRLLLNMTQGLDNGLDPSNWWNVMGTTPTIPSILLILGLLFALARIGRGSGPERRIAEAACLVGFAASLQMFKVGASFNYYMEFFALCCLLCALQLARVWRGHPGLIRTLALWALVAPLVIYDARLGLSRAKADLNTALRAHSERALFAAVREIEGPILTQTSDLALARPAPPTILDYVHYSIMVRRGFIPGADLENRVRNRAFSAIILVSANLDAARAARPSDSIFFDPAFIRLVDENYELAGQIEPMSILRPRKAAP